jgi:hypothetical protein
VKALVRIACVLLIGLLGACGGGEPAGSSASSPAPQDERLVLDNMSWDQGNWAD